ncbi:hypothetical protein Hanom_Chr11g00984511 [Helianthus anomalus]
MFSQMGSEEKVNFLFSQLQAAAEQINRHSEFMIANRNTVLKQQVEINKLKENVSKQLAEIIQLRAENERLKVANNEQARQMVQLQAADDERARQLLQMRAADNTRGIELNRVKEQSIAMKQSADRLAERHNFMKNWYDTRNTTLVDGFKLIKDAFEISRKRVNIMWNDRCKAQEVQRKRDHDNEDQGNPTVATQGRSDGLKDDVAQLESGIALQECPPESSTAGANVASSSADIDLQACPTVNREDLEDGEFIFDMTDEQILS